MKRDCCASLMPGECFYFYMMPLQNLFKLYEAFSMFFFFVFFFVYTFIYTYTFFQIPKCNIFIFYTIFIIIIFTYISDLIVIKKKNPKCNICIYNYYYFHILNFIFYLCFKYGVKCNFHLTNDKNGTH